MIIDSKINNQGGWYMRSARRFVLALFISMCSWSAAHAAFTFNGALEPLDPAIPGLVRVFRNGAASTCAAAKAFPGTNAVAAARTYKTTTAYNNAGAPTCITVNVDQGTCGTNAFTTAYLGSFNPNDLSQNYLADQGSSVTGSFSFLAPANSKIVFMTSTVSAVAGPCTYTITSGELSSSPAASVSSVPAISDWAALALTLLVAAGGITAMRRRS
jgi:hypothetical protein